jgi:Ni,Fe-hydrogenase III large subunit
MSALSIIQAGATDPARPWPRRVLTPGAWRDLAAALAGDAELDLIGLWADTLQVHALFLHAPPYAPVAVSAPVVDGAYAALSPHRPAAAWFERMIHDLWGHRAEGGTDSRAWLDHGGWAAARPMSPRPVPVPAGAEPPEFAAPGNEDWHQLALGPVHGLIAPPAHFRLTLAGETVARLEARLGYAHRGHLTLMRGKSPRAAARYAARIAADATVAHAIAFARAAEAALDVAPPPRAVALRTVMAELERIAAHLAALEALCEAAGAAREAGLAGLHREALARAVALGFGHRMMMDCVVPGGAALDLAAAGLAPLLDALAALPGFALPGFALPGFALPETRLAGLAVIPAAVLRGIAPGGTIGRAAGRPFDARLLALAGDYQALDLAVPTASGGDALARARLRLAEIAESARLVRGLVATLPEGPLTTALPMSSGEGFGVAESARGDVWHWLRLDGGLIAAAFPCDPAWRQLPLLEAAMAGVPLETLALAAASLDCSVPGMDL